jgi:hypothetical protein
MIFPSLFLTIISCVNGAPVIPNAFIKIVPAGRPTPYSPLVVNPVLPWYENDGDWLQEFYSRPPVQANTESLDGLKPAAVSPFQFTVPHPPQRRTVSMDEREEEDVLHKEKGNVLSDFSDVGFWEASGNWFDKVHSKQEDTHILNVDGDWLKEGDNLDVGGNWFKINHHLNRGK